MTAIWELDLLPNDKFILLAFADHSDDSGYCYPSLYRICWKCGVSKDSIRRCLARMVFKGIVVILRKGTGRGHTTLYQLHPEKGSKLRPFKAERVAPKSNKGSHPERIKGSTLSIHESSLESSLKHMNRRSRALDRSLEVEIHAGQGPELPPGARITRKHG